ncbi:MAG: hypothetical protein V5A62_18255 [Haloarculaceae archaeon]
MARWYLTGDEEASRRAAGVCGSAGLDTSGYRSGPGYDVRAYEKRAIEATNFVELGAGEWICSAGTVVSDGELGEAPLREMYRQLASDGVPGGRSSVFGHYAVAAKRGDTVTVFTDPMGAFRLYYGEDDSRLVVSNSLQVVAESLPSRTVDPIRVIEDAFQQAISTGEDTFYEGVKRLFGSQVLTVDLPEGELSVDRLPTEPHDVSRDTSSISEAVERYRSEVRDVFGQLAGIDSIALNATGGLDTRTVLAALLDAGISPQLMYGVGNSGLTNTKRADLETGLELAETLDLPYYRMDWSDDHPHDRETLAELFERHGFLFSKYGTPRQMLAELDGGITPYPTLQLGGYSPAFTNKRLWETDQGGYSFEELVEHFVHAGVDDTAFECEECYREDLAREVRIALERGSIDYPDRNAPLGTFVRARLLLYVRPSADPANLFNEFAYYLAPFLLKQLYDPLLEVPMEYRRNDEFQVRLIHALQPEVFEAPVFSGIEPATIDLETFTMRRPLPLRLRRRAREIGGRVVPEPAEPLAWWAYQRIASDTNDGSDIDERIRQENGRYVLENPLTAACFSDVPDIGLVYLNNLARYAFGIGEIGYSGVRTGTTGGDDPEGNQPTGSPSAGER